MIIRGTTPTIQFSFKVVDPSTISKAILTIKKGGEIAIEKALESASVGETSLSWTLTQAETLSVAGAAEIMLNWVTQDGTRGASKAATASFTPNHIEEVI